MAINIKNWISRLFTNGPTISFSQHQRGGFWVGNLFLYCLVNMFYLRLNSGNWIDSQYTHTSHNLIAQLLSPLNIFEYPSYIIVAGIIMPCSVRCRFLPHNFTISGTQFLLYWQSIFWDTITCSASAYWLAAPPRACNPCGSNPNLSQPFSVCCPKFYTG